MDCIRSIGGHSGRPTGADDQIVAFEREHDERS